MLLSIAADERAALQFADIASSLDAGLPLPALGADPNAGDRAVHAAMQKRGVRLTTTEDAVLLHAWRAGRASQALRRCAAGRERRAQFARHVWAGLRYPFLLLVMILVASIATAGVIGSGFLIGVVIAYSIAGAGAFWLRGRIHAGAPWITRVPVARHLVPGLGELPYLETLHALYGSGVPIAAAHAQAVGTVRVAMVRERLAIADAIVQRGQPLREGLQQALALHPETRSLLATGEQAGQLEDALQRALLRRIDVTGRDLEQFARRLGQIAYFAAAAVCVILILKFYGSYFGGWRR